MENTEIRMALPSGTQLQEFRITGVLGVGGFGMVYSAYDTLLERDVAIKEYFPAAAAMRADDGTVVPRSGKDAASYAQGLKRFMQEAKVLAQFKHHALAEIFRFWEQNGSAYIAMPKYAGATLKALVDRDTHAASEAWLRPVMRVLLDVVEALHERGIIHRDISPENVFVLESGQPVLLDLGASPDVVSHDTEAMTVTLKYGYAPIEQYSNDSEVMPQGPWTDIYALCATAYFAISRTAPPASVGRLIKDTILTLAPAAYPAYSAPFLAAVQSGLAVRPSERPQSVAALRSLLAVPEPERKAAGADVNAAVGVPQSLDEGLLFPLPAAAEDMWPETEAAPLEAVVDTVAAPSPPPAVLPRAEPQAGSRAPVAAPPVTAAAPRAAPRAASLAAPGAAAPAGSAHRSSVRKGAIIAVVAGLLVVGGVLMQRRAPAPPVASNAVPGPQPSLPAVAPPPAAPAVVAVPPPAPPPSIDTAGALPSPSMPPAGPPGVADAAAPAAVPVAQGTVQFNVLPWGNILVDNRDRGVSPPLKRLQLPPGRYAIVVTSPGFAPYSTSVEVQPDRVVEISHEFR